MGSYSLPMFWEKANPKPKLVNRFISMITLSEKIILWSINCISISICYTVFQFNSSAKGKNHLLTQGIGTVKTIEYEQLLFESWQNTRSSVKYCDHWKK